ncbi:MAG: hypothetical protein F6K19_25355 [Cyanothece sp. SIO1E1]|nr:hypothetical protein [Cyanothece sp. SIO1E1]
MHPDRKFVSPWLSHLFILLLVVGIVFRFSNLDHKIYWHDEVVTSARITGHSGEEFRQHVIDGHLVSVDELQQYQRLTPEKDLDDLLHSLAIEDAHHPPLYYVLMRFWVQLWGSSSVTITRSLSALFSLLAFPCLYWLCLELFEAPATGWMAMALLAISPLHLLYAQEARQYSLWGVTTLLSSAALLRALRVKSITSWGVYAITLALGFYTFLLSALVAIAHGLYTILTGHRRWLKTIPAYLLASLGGVLLFAPWMLMLINNWFKVRQATAWTLNSTSKIGLVKSWIYNLIALFIDFGLERQYPYVFWVAIPMLLLLIYALYSLCRQTPKQTWLFVVLLIGVTSLPLILPDLMWGGQRSISARYFIPSYIGIHLVVAYLLTDKLTQVRAIQQKIGWFLATILIVGGVVSCGMISQAQVWWHHAIGRDNPQIAEIINQVPNPLVITTLANSNPGNLIGLSYLLEPSVKFQLVRDPDLPRIPSEFRDVFLFHPSETLRQGIEQEYNTSAEPIGQSTLLKLKYLH